MVSSQTYRTLKLREMGVFFKNQSNLKDSEDKTNCGLKNCHFLHFFNPAWVVSTSSASNLTQSLPGTLRNNLPFNLSLPKPGPFHPSKIIRCLLHWNWCQIYVQRPCLLSIMTNHAMFTFNHGQSHLVQFQSQPIMPNFISIHYHLLPERIQMNKPDEAQ